MIENLRIFSKANNELNFPEYNWEIGKKIYISGFISLGLDDKIEFTVNKAPTLFKILRIIQAIQNQEKNFQISLEGERRTITILNITWKELIIYEGESTQVPIIHSRRYLGNLMGKLQHEIITQLLPTNQTFRRYYIDLIQGNRRKKHADFYKQFKFVGGDKVKTTSFTEGEYREGLIYTEEYHSKEKYKYYTIFTEGKVHKRRYKEEELTLNENTPDNNVHDDHAG